MKKEMAFFKMARESVVEAASYLVSHMEKNYKMALLYSSSFLELFGDLIVGWQLLWQARIAQEKLLTLGFEGDLKGADALAKDNNDAAYYIGKIAAARYFANTILIRVPEKVKVIPELVA